MELKCEYRVKIGKVAWISKMSVTNNPHPPILDSALIEISDGTLAKDRCAYNKEYKMNFIAISYSAQR